MKRKEKIIIAKEQSIVPPRNVSFFNESGVIAQLEDGNEKMLTSGRQRNFGTQYESDPFVKSISNRINENCSFVVDWQMPEE